MSQISIRRSHSLTLDAARGVAEKIAAKLGRDFGLEWAWKRNVLQFARPGVDGELHVTDGEVRLEAKLGMLLGFMKPRIEHEIDAEFDRYFRPGGGKKTAAKKAAPAGRAGKKGPRR